MLNLLKRLEYLTVLRSFFSPCGGTFLVGMMLLMKRTELISLLLPLNEKLYQMAYCLIPDDLQAEQLVIDGVNAFLLKEQKWVARLIEDDSEKSLSNHVRRQLLKKVLKYQFEIGQRRSFQLIDQYRTFIPTEFKKFYDLDVKVRAVMTLRFDFLFQVEEIEDICQMARFEVIEKLHNGRFMLSKDLETVKLTMESHP